jgi:hypothetical protein
MVQKKDNVEGKTNDGHLDSLRVGMTTAGQDVQSSTLQSEKDLGLFPSNAKRVGSFSIPYSVF